MKLGIQFHAFLLGASGISIIWLGPFWTLGFSTVGLLFSFANFVQSLRHPEKNLPAWVVGLMVFLYGAFAATAVFLYFLFGAPIPSVEIPLTQKVSLHSEKITLRVPHNWKTSPFTTTNERGVVLDAVPQSGEYIGLQQIKIVLKHIEHADGSRIPLEGEAVEFGSENAILNVFTVKKFWFKFHQVTLLGFKGPKTLCSVSTTVLPPYLPLAKDLCKGLFKNVEVQATLQP